MKKSFVFITALCMTLLLCSCWDYTELNLRPIITGLALDEGEDGNYLMTVELMTFEGKAASARLLKAQAKTLDACVEGIARQLGRHPYWNHAKILLIGEALFKQDVIPVLDWFVHAHDFSLGLLIALVEDCPAAELLKDSKSEIPQAITLDLMLNDQVSFGEIPACPLYKLYDSLLTKDAVVSIPRITLTKEEPHVIYAGVLTLEGNERRLQP